MNAEAQAFAAHLATLVEAVSKQAPDVAGLTARIEALEKKVELLVVALGELNTPEQIDALVKPVPPPVDVEPVMVVRGTPKRSSNRTVGKKR